MGEPSLKSNVLAAIQQNLPQGVHTDQILDQADLQRDLGLDSLGLATIVTQLHEQFPMDLNTVAENLGDIRCVADFIRLLQDAVESQ